MSPDQLAQWLEHWSWKWFTNLKGGGFDFWSRALTWVAV